MRTSTAGYCPKRARRLAALQAMGATAVSGLTPETHVGGYVAPVVGAAVVGVGALVMGLPTAFIAGGAVVGAVAGTWLASVATQTQEA